MDIPTIMRAGDFPEGAPSGPGVCGIDEAGRGPLAGPVTAACVVLAADFPVGLLDDSKALAESRRERACSVILDRSLAWSLGWASHEEIDRLNILGATMLAMRRAYRMLGMIPEIVYVDGNRKPELFSTPGGDSCRAGWTVQVIPVVGGDGLIPAIMAASILAKVFRDRVMLRFDELLPEYGYHRHKGYPTKEHRAICHSRGPSPIQRTSFRY